MDGVFRATLSAFLLFILLCPKGQSQSMSLRMGYGVNNGGAVNDSTGERRVNNNQELRVEFLVKLKSFLFLGIGTGSKSLSYVNGELAYELGEWDRFYDIQPTVRLNVFPVFTSILLQGNVAPWARVYLTGGVGAYFGDVKAEAEWVITGGVPFKCQYQYSSDTWTLAYHLGGGVDVSLGEVFSLYLEALYNPITFTDFEDIKEQTQAGWNPIIPETGEPLFPSDFLYEISEFSFSGLSLNLGIGVVF
jgi:hypothetical protein